MTIDIIIPKAVYHADIDTAIYSARQQTIPVNIIEILDTHKRGAAWARNQGLQQATGDFVVFLDADDSLEPGFVETCLRHYEQGKYIYTNWRLDNGNIAKPKPCFDIVTESMVHIITTLLPRKAAMYVNGFDETLPGMEDIDFYMRLHRAGICGKYIDADLVTYNRNAGYSPVSPNRDKIAVANWLQGFYQTMNNRYGRMGNMCKCKESQPRDLPPTAPGENDVLVMAQFTPRRHVGTVTGTRYQRTRLNVPFYMHRDDAEARPDLYSVLADPRMISPDVDSVMDLLR